MKRSLSLSPSVVHGAFTMTELLVSMTILTLLIVMVAQLVSSATSVTTGSRKHMDADTQARQVFDRMSGDIARMIQRTDVDYIFSTQTGNDKMFFYSEAPAFYTGANATTAASSVALLGWRINSNYQMERLGKRLAWDGTTGSMLFLTYPSGSTTPTAASQIDSGWSTTVGASPSFNGADTDYHVIGDGVCRMEFCFQNKDGTYTNGTIGSGTTALTRSLSGFSAIVVAIVILDTNSRQQTNPATVSAGFTDSTAAELKPATTPDPSNPPTLMAAKWTAQLQAGITGVPVAAASQIRIYQRTFYLNAK